MPQKILHALKQSSTFLSGTALSRALGITRAAVWKQIRTLRSRGFVIEAIPSRGYRLVSTPSLSEEEIREGLTGEFWQRIEVNETVDSTNARAGSLLAEHPHASSMVIIADRQTAGRGRLGRKWISPAGVNVYMSLLIRPEMEPRDAPFLTLIAAVAAACAVSRVAGLAVQLKWPNDLMIKNRKIGGILTEVRTEPDRITTATIGIGINVNMTSAHFPAEIRETATSLYLATGKSFSRGRIISEIMNDFEQQYKEFLRKGRGVILKEWRSLNCTLGKKVKVIIGDESTVGYALDIGDDGRLIIRTSGGLQKKISAGDISFYSKKRTG